MASYLLNYWANRGKRLCLVTLHEKPSDAYIVDSRVERVCIHPRTKNHSLSNRLEVLVLFVNSISNVLESYLGRLTSSISSRGSHFFLIRTLEGVLKILECSHKIAELGFRTLKGVRKILKSVSEIMAKAFLYLPLSKARLSDDNYLKMCSLAVALGGYQKTVRRIKRLRSFLEETKHDVLLSFLGATNLQTIIAGFGNAAKLVISERNDPAMQKLAFPWEQLRKHLYTKADVVTANSYGAIETMKSFVSVEKLVYVPNPVIIPAGSLKIRGRREIILYVGRLVLQKGVDILIEAFNRISDRIPTWKLEIVGNGPIMGELKSLAGRSRAGSRVTFYGHRTNVHDFYRQASIFALPSRFEGLPNALLEAMCWGLPVVTSDASPGPLEVVRQGYNGLVFPSENISAMAEALLELAGDKVIRKQMSLNSRKVSRRYALESVMHEWEMTLFKS